MSSISSPTGYWAHYGKRYRVAGDIAIVWQLSLPVLPIDPGSTASFVLDEDGDAVGVKRYATRRNGLTFMTVNASPEPVRDIEVGE